MNQPMSAAYGGLSSNAAQRNRVLRNTYALLSLLIRHSNTFKPRT